MSDHEVSSSPTPTVDRLMEPLLILNLSRGAQVVEYGLARRILWLAGVKAVRKMEGQNDYLTVYKCDMPGERSSLYVPPKERSDDQIMRRLTVDEGSYTDCLVSVPVPPASAGRVVYSFDESTALMYTNSPDMELVDFCDLVEILANLAAPGHKVRPSPFMGRGYTQQHYHSEHLKALSDCPKNADGLVIIYRLGLKVPAFVETTPDRKDPTPTAVAAPVPNPLA